MSELYKRHNYTNKYVEIIIGNDIYEYDIASAGFNLLKKYKLISEDELCKLEKISKKTRQVTIGLMMRHDKELNKSLTNAFVEIRREFFIANNIEDDDILSIKKDAIFTLKPCHNLIFDNVEFVKKNVYTSYICIDKKEIFTNKNTVHVKGINDEKVKNHTDYMGSIILTTMRYLENLDNKGMTQFIKEVMYLYKNRELPIEYYREFNRESYYRDRDNPSLLYDDIGKPELVDITYNYINILIPLQNILI